MEKLKTPTSNMVSGYYDKTSSDPIRFYQDDATDFLLRVTTDNTEPTVYSTIKELAPEYMTVSLPCVIKVKAFAISPLYENSDTLTIDLKKVSELPQPQHNISIKFSESARLDDVEFFLDGVESSYFDIFYTTDGMQPTNMSHKYTEKITLDLPTYVKCKAISKFPGYKDSYTTGILVKRKLKSPVITLPQGEYTEDLLQTDITINEDNKDLVDVYYTTDGTIPDVDSPRWENTSISIQNPGYIHCVAIHKTNDNMYMSSELSDLYKYWKPIKYNLDVTNITNDSAELIVNVDEKSFRYDIDKRFHNKFEWYTILESLPVYTGYHNVVFYKDRLYIHGGRYNSNKSVDLYSYDSVLCYDTVTKTCSTPYEYDSPKNAVSYMNNNIMYTVGTSSSGAYTLKNIYNCDTNQWIGGVYMGINAKYPAFTMLNNKVYIHGGGNGDSDKVSVYCLDQGTATWYHVAPVLCGRFKAAMYTLHDNIYIAGGVGQAESSDPYMTTKLNTVERYNPTVNRWVPAKSMNDVKPYAHVFIVDENRILVQSENDGDDTSLCELYDYNTDTWTDVTVESDNPDELFSRNSASCTDIEGNHYMVGGIGLDGIPNGRISKLNISEIIDATTVKGIPKLYYKKIREGVCRPFSGSTKTIVLDKQIITPVFITAKYEDEV